MEKLIFVLVTLLLIGANWISNPIKNEYVERNIKHEEFTLSKWGLKGNIRSITQYTISSKDTFLCEGLILKEHPRYQQFSADPLVKMVWSDSILTGCSHYYSKDGNALKSVWWNDNFGAALVDFFYDKRQNLVEKNYYIESEKGPNELSKELKFKYDNNDNLIEFCKSTKEFPIKECSSITYKGNRAFAKIIKKNFKSGKIEYSNYVWEADGEMRLHDENEQAEYDKHGNLIKLIRATYEANYEYDENDNLIEKTIYDKNDRLINKVNISYFKNGKKRLQTEKSIDNPLEHNSETEFNQHGKVLKDNFYVGSSMESYSEKEYRYDKYSVNMIYRKESENDYELKEEESFIRRYEYKYDEHKNWFEQLEFIGDSLINKTRRDILYY